MVRGRRLCGEKGYILARVWAGAASGSPAGPWRWAGHAVGPVGGLGGSSGSWRGSGCGLDGVLGAEQEHLGAAGRRWCMQTPGWAVGLRKGKPWRLGGGRTSRKAR
jgi:hypothetical protein